MKLTAIGAMFYQVILTILLFLAANTAKGQGNDFNCLTAGDQQWTGFFVGRDEGKITNYSSYVIKFSVSGLQASKRTS